jgi:hypothetical protein
MRLYDRESPSSRCDYLNPTVSVIRVVINGSEMLKDGRSASSGNVTGRSEENGNYYIQYCWRQAGHRIIYLQYVNLDVV